MHAQVRQRCNSEGAECRKRKVYVPEPGAQKCVRTQRWPFIACGPVVSSRTGEEAYREQERAYRRGIVPPPPYYYQPMPPPWTMDCRYSAQGCGYGGGDPYGWGGQSPPRRHHHGHDGVAGGDVYYEDEVDKDDGSATSDPAVGGGGSDPATGNSGEWLVEDTKCKVVSANGTNIEIRNCTSDGLVENEYAAEPKVNLVSDLNGADELTDEDLRSKRYAVFDDDADDEGTLQRKHRRRNNHNRRQHLDTNSVDDADRIADDFEYSKEFEQPPYRRSSRKRHRKNHRRHHGKKQQRKIIYDDE